MKHIKKLIWVVLIFTLMLLSSCKKEENIVYYTPSADTFLTEVDVAEFVDYTPVKNIENVRGKSTVKYYPEVFGEDPVILELYYYNQKKSIAEIHEEYSNKKEARKNAYDVEGLKADAFIAYPSVNLYRDGYMLVITAGSGATEEQGELLENIAKLADDRLNEFLEENPTDSNLLK